MRSSVTHRVVLLCSFVHFLERRLKDFVLFFYFEWKCKKNFENLNERFSHSYLANVKIAEDTRGFLRSNFDQQFLIWPCKYDPQAIFLAILHQTYSYVQKQDRCKLTSQWFFFWSTTIDFSRWHGSTCSSDVYQNFGDYRLCFNIDFTSIRLFRSISWRYFTDHLSSARVGSKWTMSWRKLVQSFICVQKNSVSKFAENETMANALWLTVFSNKLKLW